MIFQSILENEPYVFTQLIPYAIAQIYFAIFLISVTNLIPPDQDAQLLQGLLQHNPKAYSELYDRYASALLTIISRFVPGQEPAQDLLQKTFVEIWKNIHRYDPAKERLFAWLSEIAQNTALDYLESR